MRTVPTTVTLPQALVLVVCVLAPILAYKLLGSEIGAGILMTTGMLLNFMLGRDPISKKDGGPDAT